MDFNQVLALVLPLVLPPLIGAVGVFFKKEEAKLPQNLQPVISSLASQAVNATEQCLTGATSSGKFAAAANFLSKSLSRFGVVLTPDEMKSVIEQAVFVMKQSQPAPEAPVQAPQPGV
jgi:excinuclease UvrABC helicase subunit UvrB